MGEHEYEVASFDVLALAAASGCAAYDCEFVALAEFLQIPFVTEDKALLAQLRPRAVSLKAAARRSS